MRILLAAQLLVYFSVAVAATLPWAPTSFVLVGDSTTNNGTTPNSGGWGNGFCGSEVTATPSSLWPGTPCINTARNGATTGTFVANGFWNVSVNAIKEEVAKGQRVFVTLQFGHNDQKIAPPESMAANLTALVQEIRELGAEAILITSLTRRTFNATTGRIQDTLLPWADATKQVAQEQSAHVLDLHAASIKYVEAIGPDAAHRLNRLPEDNTHLNSNGSIVFGRLVADLLFEAFLPDITTTLLPILPNFPLSYNITRGIASY